MTFPVIRALENYSDLIRFIDRKVHEGIIAVNDAAEIKQVDAQVYRQFELYVTDQSVECLEIVALIRAAGRMQDLLLEKYPSLATDVVGLNKSRFR